MPSRQGNPLSPENGRFDARWLYLLLWCAGSIALFWRAVAGVWHLGWRDENISHVFLIPFISGWLMFAEKLDTSKESSPDYAASALLALPALALAASVIAGAAGSATITLGTLGMVLMISAGFIFLFGRATARKSWFPLAFLLFIVPLPQVVLERFIYWLQAGSAAIAGFLFELSGVPVLREGFIFRLPRISIEVAQECSGIRSSIALVILAVLVAHFSFRPFWKKALFVAAGLLMMVVKNGIRIASLTMLANYVDSDFLYGKLHRRGGIVFFLIGLGLLIPVYQLLRRGERIASAASRTA